MSNKIRLKLNHEGEDYGYVHLKEKKKDKPFYSGGTKEEATVFEKKKYTSSVGDNADAHYFQVSGTKLYMSMRKSSDETPITSDSPTFSITYSTITGWDLSDDERLFPVLGGKTFFKAVGQLEEGKGKPLSARSIKGIVFDVIEEEV